MSLYQIMSTMVELAKRRKPIEPQMTEEKFEELKAGIRAMNLADVSI